MFVLFDDILYAYNFSPENHATVERQLPKIFEVQKFAESELADCGFRMVRICAGVKSYFKYTIKPRAGVRQAIRRAGSQFRKIRCCAPSHQA